VQKGDCVDDRSSPRWLAGRRGYFAPFEMRGRQWGGGGKRVGVEGAWQTVGAGFGGFSTVHVGTSSSLSCKTFRFGNVGGSVFFRSLFAHFKGNESGRKDVGCGRQFQSRSLLDSPGSCFALLPNSAMAMSLPSLCGYSGGQIELSIRVIICSQLH